MTKGDRDREGPSPGERQRDVGAGAGQKDRQPKPEKERDTEDERRTDERQRQGDKQRDRGRETGKGERHGEEDRPRGRHSSGGELTPSLPSSLLTAQVGAEVIGLQFPFPCARLSGLLHACPRIRVEGIKAYLLPHSHSPHSKFSPGPNRGGHKKRGKGVGPTRGRVGDAPGSPESPVAPHPPRLRLAWPGPGRGGEERGGRI